MTPYSLDLLATFARVAERGGFTAAGRDLGLSKATVSKQISELEARLGVALVARTTRSLTLTQAGREALVRARRILDEAEALAEEAALTRVAPAGPLRLAAPLAFGECWLANALPDFMALYPDIALEFSFDDRVVDLVADGFDAALRIGAMPDSSLLARRIAPVRLHLVASPAYWNERGRPRRPEDLAMHACFRYANSPLASTWVFEGPDAETVRVRVEGRLTVNNGRIELPALCAGFGCALLPDFMVHADVSAGRLETAMCDWRALERVLHVLTPPGRGRPRRLEAWIGFLVDRFGGRTPPWALD